MNFTTNFNQYENNIQGLKKTVKQKPFFLAHFLKTPKVKYTLAIFALLLGLDLAFPVKVPDNYSTVVLDDEGRILSAYLNNEDKWRLKTNVEEVSPFFLKAIIEKEDKYFYYHPGVNPVAIFRALASNIQKKKRVSGCILLYR
ncbi:transglycosylase domain-containing protein [Lacihabitans soyangensis]|uniref:transglycosylase domain-containing protein n=1 Tax=Lacihabitans soyangensis TaxID=869394 RepID=UPI0020CC9319|nr:transglycosylase domain-containing protein [Lacihabitans soyangensis]